jgi:ribonuclease-3
LTKPEVQIRDAGLLALALRHRSAGGDSVSESYERLEFFGDSILGMVVAEYLYEHFPIWDQGTLSKAKATVVQEAPLAEAALRLKLDRFIEVASSERLPGGSIRPSILADVFEAIVGALYLEQGMAVTRWFVLEHLHPYLEQVTRGEIGVGDYKSRLQEVAQAKWRRTPSYQISNEHGYAHEKTFVIEVTLEGEVMGTGSGRSKKEAEQAAARDALELIDRHEAFRKLSTDA